MEKWIFFSVPEHKKMHYVFVMFMMMFIVPKYIFGLQFTILGNFINFLIYDFIYYQWYRVEQFIIKNRRKDDENE